MYVRVMKGLYTANPHMTLNLAFLSASFFSVNSPFFLFSLQNI